MNRDTETELARRLLGGEPEAFEWFVEHFRAKIFRYSWLMCGDRADAEEVAQETLLKVFESFRQLREPERVRPWVFQIARNVCLMRRRKSMFAPDRELSLDELKPAGHEVADWGLQPDDQLLRTEMNQALARAIQDLPEGYRPVVLLRDLEELSTEETARILDLTPENVKQRLHRGRLALRRSLDQFLRNREGVHAGT